jgi:glycosyltransferase involved in cell wall biosynthesis
VVRRWRPDIIHAHYLHTAEEILDVAEEECVPVTVRAHAFDMSPAGLARVANARATAAVYVFPHLIPSGLNSPRVRPLTAAIDTARFSNGMRYDRKMVLRLGAGLPTKDLRFFMDAAKRLPGHRFVLAVAEATGMPEYVQAVRQLNDSLGGPVEIRVNVPYTEAAKLSGEAGIYLHTCDPAQPFGMPVSIGEAMAAGCYALVRRLPGAENYVGEGGACYESLEDAVALIRQTDLWGDERWEQQRRASVESARRFANEAVLDQILKDWERLVKQQAMD